MSAEERARRAFKAFITLEQVTDADLPHFQQQAREVREQHGVDHLATWLEAWAEQARADRQQRDRQQREREAASAARIAQALRFNPEAAARAEAEVQRDLARQQRLRGR